ncbi:MAG: type I restriction-modification system subunit M N-terminal domain-containing protein [Caldilineaceae bacterium]
MTTNFSQTAAYIWSLADLLRGDFKQSQYGRVILPFTILRRLECVLAASKPAVLAQAEKLKAMPNVEATARDKLLLRAAGLAFYNTSPLDLGKLGSTDIKSNLTHYVDSFRPTPARSLSTLSLPNLSPSSTRPTCSSRWCNGWQPRISAPRRSPTTDGTDL